MATKQLGKLRQWAEEKISTEKKTEATDEFKDLEVEVERRRFGLEQVYEHSRTYYRYLMKKKDIGDGDESLLPIELLGRVMVAHGQEFGSDSAYGHSLTALGNAHIKVAGLQEQFGEHFHSMFLSRLEISLAEVAQYYVLRKKLKSRRLAYDAAVSQAQKSKKEVDRVAAEEEVTQARARFEEISKDLQRQMECIQDGEMDQFRDLGRLLDMELKFAQSWVNTLQGIKADWPDNNDVYRVAPNKPKGPTHVLRPTTPSSTPSHQRAEDDDEASENSDSGTRPVRHQRSMSVTTSNSQGRKPSMSNWASSAVGSIFKKEKTGPFEALDGDDRGEPEGSLSRSQSRPEPPTAPSLSRSRSGRAAPPTPRSRAQSTLSSKHNSPRLPPRNLPGSEKHSAPKMMRATYAFSGASDELTMEAGDEITVLSEPSDTWWMGECKGQRGLFPVNYTEEMPKRPPLPMRPATLAKSGQSQPSSPVQEVTMLRIRSNSANVGKSLNASWADEPFGDHHSTLGTIAHSPDYRQLTHSTSGGEEDEDDRKGLVAGPSTSRDENGARSESATTSPALVVRQLTRSFSGKKAPPPPPARRTTSTSAHRTTSSAGYNSAESPFITASNTKWNTSGGSGRGADSARDSETVRSPFDEGDGDTGGSTAFPSFALSHKCRECSCEDFQQSLFKKDGVCNTCFHSHV